MSGSISLRSVRDEDRELLFEIYSSTREEEMAQVPWDRSAQERFLRQQFDAQHDHYRRHFAGASFDLILLDGQPVGRLYTDRRADEIRIVDVALLAEYRDAGIGSAIIGEILEEAAGLGRVVRIHVARHNRALSLYDRLGFRVVDDSGVHLLMEWMPAATDKT